VPERQVKENEREGWSILSLVWETEMSSIISTLLRLFVITTAFKAVISMTEGQNIKANGIRGGEMKHHQASSEMEMVHKIECVVIGEGRGSKVK
jgi:hypothetical protein